MDDLKLIDALGGCNAVAEILGIKAPSVHEWKQRKSIPEARRIRLAVVAEDRGLTTRKALFPKNYHEIWIELRCQASASTA